MFDFNTVRIVTSARKTALLVFAVASSAPIGNAQVVKAQQPSSPSGGATVIAVATATPADRAPVIDGRDDDPVWQSAQAIGGFRAFDPKEDGDPSLPTEAKIAYDAVNLYVSALMFDLHPA